MRSFASLLAGGIHNAEAGSAPRSIRPWQQLSRRFNRRDQTVVINEQRLIG